MKKLVVVVAYVLMIANLGVARDIWLPEEGAIVGNVLIAERFMEGEGDDAVPIDFPAWGEKTLRPSTWFDVQIEAHPGDVIVIEPGFYEAQVWIFVPNVTVMTAPEAEDLAVIRGTIEVDADRVTLERIGVTNSSNPRDSGHGIEVNGDLLDVITIRQCRSFGNRWTGIHMIGVRGTIREMRVEECELVDNGMDGMDTKSIRYLIVTGCTITGNGWDLAAGVGLRIGRYVQTVELEDNTIAGNRFADVYRKEER